MNTNLIKFKHRDTFWAKTEDSTFVLVDAENPKEEHKKYLDQLSYSNLKEYVTMIVHYNQEENSYEFINEDFGNCLALVKNHLQDKNFNKLNIKIYHWKKGDLEPILVSEISETNALWLSKLLSLSIPNKISEINNSVKIKK